MKTQFLKKMNKNKSPFFHGLVSICSLAILLAPALAKADNNEDKEIEQKIVNYVNQERAEKDLNQLNRSKVLDKAAEMKARDMLGDDYFAHNSPDGLDSWHWFKEVDYKYKYAGENLGMDFKTAESVHEAWMESTTHRENIMSSKYNEIGVAVLEGIIDDQETKVGVQMFGKKLSSGTVEAEMVMEELNQKEASPTETDKTNEQTEEQKDESALIKEVTVEPWEGEESDEILIFAGVEGGPKKVNALLGKEEFKLEELREGVYMNLISIEDEDDLRNGISVEAVDSEGNKETVQVSQDQYAEYIAKKQQVEQEKEDAALAGFYKKDFVETLRKWINQTGLIILVMALLLLTAFNVWVLEKEEERLLKTMKK
ncbi:MAG: CAP domain-containing protein [Patescibacteria group bacterium]